MEMLSRHYNGKVYSHPDKPLKEHLIKVGQIAKTYAEMLPINFIDKEIFKSWIELTALYHDIGKATSFFQEYLQEKDPDKKARLKNMGETHHSLLSAVATYFAIEKYLKENKIDNQYIKFLPVASFLAVRRHHTDLQTVLDDITLNEGEILKRQIRNLFNEYLDFLPYWDDVYDKLTHLKWPLRKISFVSTLKSYQGCLAYIIQNLVYSLLLDSDKHEVTIGSPPDRKYLFYDMVDAYRVKRNFTKPKRQIDIFRNEIYRKIVAQVSNINIEKEHIFSLSAPTGSGKTLAALGFALKLRERILNEKGYSPRIIYSLPFLSIIDQNASVIEEIFRLTLGREPTNDLFLTHHHLSDYSYKTENVEYETQESEIFVEGWDSEIIITTFVQFFHTLFSNKNSAIRKFHKLTGSIVILDEIQSFPSKYWELFKEVAEQMGRYLNAYFILSTATQPAIFDFPKELLVEGEKYFKVFKRTQVKIRTATTLTISQFADGFIKTQKMNPKNTLIVFNTVNCAEEFYKLLKRELQNTEFEIFYLSSHVVPIERLERIRKIKQTKQEKIVVSTQLVEAGVDIDLEKVFRDLAPLDSIIQAAGRGNREFNLSVGEVDVILLKDEKTNRYFYSYIYDPVLIDATKQIIRHFSVVNENELQKLCENYYCQLKSKISCDISTQYLEAIKTLNYSKIGEFELIKEKGEKIDIFVELNDEATRVWKEYQEIVKTNDFMERRKKFLEIRGIFYQYVISVLLSKAKTNLPPEVSGIKFISKAQLQEFYDYETGFKIQADTLIW